MKAEDYIFSCTTGPGKPGLSRIRELAGRLGDPQKGLRCIHVTGSNGKGSTCAMLAEVLSCAGYRTGLFTSPHIQDFRERIKVDGEMIPPEDLERITDSIKPAIESMEAHPGVFEIITAVALCYFRERKCDFVVLEVGMGGEFDATNIIDPPEVCAITNVGLEHTDVLGKTIEEIARTKSGIIKQGSDLVCYDGDPKVSEIANNRCKDVGAVFTGLDFSRLTPVSKGLDGQRFTWDGRPYSIRLLGEHQLHNAAMVLTICERLNARGIPVPEDAVRKGLEKAAWPVRFEVMSEDPLFVIDGGHNPQCAAALAGMLDGYFPGEKFIFLMGIFRDKDFSGVLDIILPYAAGFVCMEPDSPRAMPAEELASLVRSRGAQALACACAEDAFHAAKALAKAPGAVRPAGVIAFGSLYLAGEIRDLFSQK